MCGTQGCHNSLHVPDSSWSIYWMTSCYNTGLTVKNKMIWTRLKLISLSCKTLDRHSRAGSTIVRVSGYFCPISLPSSTWGFHLLSQHGCSDSCYHNCIPASANRKRRSWKYVPFLWGTAQRFVTSISPECTLERQTSFFSSVHS